MTNFDRLPADLLKRKAVVYVRQSTQAQVQLNVESQRRQYELVQEAKRRGFRDVKSSMMIWGARQAARLRGRASIAWSHCCAQATSVRCFAWMPHVLPVTGVTGIICSNSVVSLKRE